MPHRSHTSYGTSTLKKYSTSKRTIDAYRPGWPSARNLKGSRFFVLHECIACHESAAPNLAGIGSRTLSQIQESIVNPSADGPSMWWRFGAVTKDGRKSLDDAVDWGRNGVGSKQSHPVKDEFCDCLRERPCMST